MRRLELPGWICLLRTNGWVLLVDAWRRVSFRGFIEALRANEAGLLVGDVTTLVDAGMDLAVANERSWAAG